MALLTVVGGGGKKEKSRREMNIVVDTGNEAVHKPSKKAWNLHDFTRNHSIQGDVVPTVISNA